MKKALESTEQGTLKHNTHALLEYLEWLERYGEKVKTYPNKPKLTKLSQFTCLLLLAYSKRLIQRIFTTFMALRE